MPQAPAHVRFGRVFEETAGTDSDLDVDGDLPCSCARTVQGGEHKHGRRMSMLMFIPTFPQSVSSRTTRNKAIASSFRSLFEKPRNSSELARFEHDMQDAITFMRSQRMHKVRMRLLDWLCSLFTVSLQTLLERYNPLHDMTTEERVKATARRVGLDMPVKTSGEGDQ